MNPIEQHEYISKYLLEELTTDENIIFEEVMKNDAEFAKEVEFQKMIVEGIEAVEKEKVFDSFKNFDAQISQPKTETYPFRKLIWIGSSLAASILIAVIFLFNRGNNQGKELFAQNFEPYPTNVEYLSLPRGDESPVEGLTFEEYTQSVKAMQAYDKKDYKSALTGFEHIKQLKDKNPELLFYMAICQLAKNKTEPAIENLEWLNKTGNFKYDEDVKWYLALGYLKINKKEEARAYLLHIKKLNKSKVKTILETMK